MFLNDSDFCLESIIRCCKSKTCTATEVATPLTEELRERADDDLRWELWGMSHTEAPHLQHNIWKEAKKAEYFLAYQLGSDTLLTSLKILIFLDARNDKIWKTN